jgi:hypothetical protein
MTRSASRKQPGGTLARHLQAPTARERQALAPVEAAGETAAPSADVLRPAEFAPVKEVWIRSETGQVLLALPVEVFMAAVRHDPVALFAAIGTSAKVAVEERGTVALNDPPGYKMAQQEDEPMSGAVEVSTSTVSNYAATKRYQNRASDDWAYLNAEASKAGLLDELHAVLDGTRTLPALSAVANLTPAAKTAVNMRWRSRVNNARKLVTGVMKAQGLGEYDRREAVRRVVRELRSIV